MECARQGCEMEAVAGGNNCREHSDLDKANVDDPDGSGEGGDGGA